MDRAPGVGTTGIRMTTTVMVTTTTRAMGKRRLGFVRGKRGEGGCCRLSCSLEELDIGNAVVVSAESSPIALHRLASMPVFRVSRPQHSSVSAPNHLDSHPIPSLPPPPPAAAFSVPSHSRPLSPSLQPQSPSCSCRYLPSSIRLLRC